jgi:hypothetical protein
MAEGIAGFRTHDESPPQRLRDRFRRMFAAYDELPLPPLPDDPLAEVSFRQEPRDPVLALGAGDAFDFEVYPTFGWQARVPTVDDLEIRAAAFRTRALRTVENFVRPIARNHPPHRACALESDVNEQADGKRWRFDSDGTALRLTFTVRIVPEERVREQLRPYQEKRIRMDCEHELGIQRARQVEELTRHWSAILDTLDQDPRTMHAAMLSEEDFAHVFGDFVKGRQQGLRDLLDLLRVAVKGHSDIGLGPSEYTRAWDEALKAFQRQHGLHHANGAGTGQPADG